jgi:hypothetical protein
MVERVCPTCAQGNPIDAAFCTSCGGALEAPLARRARSSLARLAPELPVRWQQAGKAVALGAVTLAVEAGAAWLQHRAAQKPAPLARSPRSGGASYVARQRVWETYEDGNLRRRVVEQTIWHLPDEP